MSPVPIETTGCEPGGAVASSGRPTCRVCGILQEKRFEYRGHEYRRCPSCGLVSTFPIPDDEEIERHYARKFESGNYRLLQEFSRDYARVYLDLVEVLTDRLAEAGESLEGKRVLDVGCFTGDLLVLLRERGADVYGIELQDDAVRLAEEKLPGRVFRVGPDDLEIPERSFDVVVCTSVIEHLKRPVAMLERLVARLAPGGTILLQTPDASSLPARAMGRYWPPFEPVEHIHLFSRRALERVLRDRGVEEIASRRHVKRLPVAYVVRMLENFGPELHRWIRPLARRLPAFLGRRVLPFYVGETVITGRKSEGLDATGSDGAGARRGPSSDPPDPSNPTSSNLSNR